MRSRTELVLLTSFFGFFWSLSVHHSPSSPQMPPHCRSCSLLRISVSSANRSNFGPSYTQHFVFVVEMNMQIFVFHHCSVFKPWMSMALAGWPSLCYGSLGTFSPACYKHNLFSFLQLNLWKNAKNNVWHIKCTLAPTMWFSKSYWHITLQWT